MPSELLSVRDLAVDFVTDQGVARVLDRINVDIQPGEVVGLVGFMDGQARDQTDQRPVPAHRAPSTRASYPTRHTPSQSLTSTTTLSPLTIQPQQAAKMTKAKRSARRHEIRKEDTSSDDLKG